MGTTAIIILCLVLIGFAAGLIELVVWVMTKLFKLLNL